MKLGTTDMDISHTGFGSWGIAGARDVSQVEGWVPAGSLTLTAAIQASATEGPVTP
ncbi:hypothetical protein [Nonomuraea sp. NPDC049784]|uniref:hypothetical protein n=1 Tax=Nonomuraea sp. NPDC049784 TaxID=3154361 RepID=UPI0033CF908F